MNEEENTFRALKDEPPLATSIWCRIGIHNWSKWSKSFKPLNNRNKHVQTRHCANCNIVRVKEVKVPHWMT